MGRCRREQHTCNHTNEKCTTKPVSLLLLTNIDAQTLYHKLQTTHSRHPHLSPKDPERCNLHFQEAVGMWRKHVWNNGGHQFFVLLRVTLSTVLTERQGTVTRSFTLYLKCSCSAKESKTECEKRKSYMTSQYWQLLLPYQTFRKQMILHVQNVLGVVQGVSGKIWTSLANSFLEEQTPGTRNCIKYTCACKSGHDNNILNFCLLCSICSNKQESVLIEDHKYK